MRAVTCEPHEQLRPISVDEYHRMIDVGILTEEDKVELLDGLIVAVPPEGPHHADVICELNWRIARALPEDRRFRLRVGNPLTFRPRSEPEPDLAIVDPRPGGPRAHPSAAHLVIEVSRSSRRVDRGRKAAIYARAGVPEYWIVDLVEMCVEVRTAPRGGEYTRVDVLRPPATLRSARLPLPEIDVGELLSPE